MSGGDLPEDELRAALHRAADMAVDYVQSVEEYSVLSDVAPGEVRLALPEEPPVESESMEEILDDYRRIIEPGLTHWNHPGFMAYFGITGSGPGIVGDLLSAATNVNAMLWRTSPAATELEELVCDWLRQMVGLPGVFRGHINDTASMATFLSLAVARDALGLEIRERGQGGRPELPALTVYTSDQAHSSIDKAAIALGLGLENVRRIPSDSEYRMDVSALEEVIARDRTEGLLPVAVVGTAGTTSTTSVDPLAAIAEVCEREKLWFHVDAAYGGAAAVLPEKRELFLGWEKAQTIVINPHKWLFTPFDCSVMFVREPEAFRRAFSVVPEYLESSEEGVTNLMDLGIQLGRRFRALKLWMVIRAFGVEGLRQRIAAHCALARSLADRVRRDERFELILDPPMSTVCLRLLGRDPMTSDRLNLELIEQVNAPGEVFLSHTKLDDRIVIRVAIGNIKTGERQVDRVWDLLQQGAGVLLGR